MAGLEGGVAGVSRRAVLGTAACTVAGQVVPDAQWWARAARDCAGRTPTDRHLVRRSDVEATRDAVRFFSRLDQRHGGGKVKVAVMRYLTSDVAPLLNGRFADDIPGDRLTGHAEWSGMRTLQGGVHLDVTTASGDGHG
ncbi:MAG: hypothetical protein ACRCYX_02535 [Dermatophilaceae bacterium]